MEKYRVIGFYTIAEQVDDIEAENEQEAIEIAKKKIGRTISEYHKVEFEIEQDFI